MLSFVLSLLGGTFKDWLSSKQEIDKAKAVARVEAVSKGIPGYSDEFLLAVLSWPFIAGFLPFEWAQQSAANGMAHFAAMPEWYQLCFGTVVAAIFGIDKVFRFKK